MTAKRIQKTRIFAIVLESLYSVYSKMSFCAPSMKPMR